MTVTVEHELPRPAAGPGFSDALTISFGDVAADVYGIARIGLSAGGEPAGTTASGLGIMFAGGEPVAVRAAGGAPVAAPDWEGVGAAGVRTAVIEPLQAWSVSFTDEDGQTGFDLQLRALGPPAELPADAPPARLGGMSGYDQLCSVTGTASVRGAARAIDCRGQRGHSWGAPDWEQIVLARTVSAWIDDGPGVLVTAVRHRRARGHGEEAVAAFLLEPGEEPGEHTVQLMGDPRVSTVYDAEGRQRHAGLELYRDDDDDMGRRLAGEAICGTSLDLGRLRLECAFFRWRMEGRVGVGRYDVVRRAA